MGKNASFPIFLYAPQQVPLLSSLSTEKTLWFGGLAF